MSNEESGFISDWAGCWIGPGKGGKEKKRGEETRRAEERDER